MFPSGDSARAPENGDAEHQLIEAAQHPSILTADFVPEAFAITCGLHAAHGVPQSLFCVMPVGRCHDRMSIRVPKFAHQPAELVDVELDFQITG